jgi:GNAT superfamily N-acetyltransferase
MIYRIKRVDGEDEEIAELIRELHDETFGREAPQIDPSCGWSWIAYDGREVAGFCHLVHTEGATRDTLAYLKRAGLRLPHRGQGLQRRFVRVREALARRAGFKACVSDTTDNPSSANNLIKCGYKIYTPQQPWGFNNTIYWYKELHRND